MEIGPQLSEARQQQHLTQQAVATQLHVARQTVSSWETGNSFPDIDSILALCELYHLSLDHLLRPDSDLVANMQAQARALRQARWLYVTSLALDVLILVVMVCDALHVPGFTMGLPVLLVLDAICLVVGFVLLKATRDYRRLTGRRRLVQHWAKICFALAFHWSRREW